MNINEIAAKTLGSDNSYAVYTTTCDKTLLNPMPRGLVRNDAGTVQSPYGYDTWYAYEATYIDARRNVPVSGCLKIVVPSHSEFMVESKSLKLYLNTFDMMVITQEDYVSTIKGDLQALLKCHVYVTFMEYMLNETMCVPLMGDEIVVNHLADQSEAVDYHGNFKLSQEHLQNLAWRDVRYVVPSLRSRCRHTKQKDSGYAFFEFVNNSRNPTASIITEDALLRAVLTLREVNEFHEFCCEKLYADLKNLMGPDVLVTVTLYYQRRGGIDINPTRSDVCVSDFNDNFNKGFAGQ